MGRLVLLLTEAAGTFFSVDPGTAAISWTSKGTPACSPDESIDVAFSEVTARQGRSIYPALAVVLRADQQPEMGATAVWAPAQTFVAEVRDYSY